ncbi:MAG: hypothetical protein ACFCUH_11240, partial [Flavobacteriales bacterium]
MFTARTAVTPRNGNDITHRSHTQSRSDVGLVGMGEAEGETRPQCGACAYRKPRRGAGNGRASTYVSTGLACGVCARRWTGSVTISSVLHPSLPKLRHYVA